MRKIQEDNIPYRIIFNLVRFAYRRFFRQIDVSGLENIPSGEPVIFAPNHQSGLMDPLSVILNQHDPIVFMARADIFNSKIFSKFLHFLKLMPVYRIRDGFENLAKNEDQFNIARDILMDRKKLCVMPEGNHGHQHKLRPLVKGIFRIAFSAEEALAGNAHVRIIPVSIDYDFYQHAGADMVIKYGNPINIEDYYPLYKENQANAFNILKSDLSVILSGMMHDIRSTENYDFIYRLCCYGTPAYLEIQAEKGIKSIERTRPGKNFEARKTIGLKLDELEKTGFIFREDYRKICEKLDLLPGYPSEITEWMELKPSLPGHMFNLLMSILSLPGLIMNLPAFLVNIMLCKKVEDKQMHNTYAFVSGLLLYPIMYIITSIILGEVLNLGVLQTLVLLLFLFLTGLVGERIRQYLRIPFRNLVYTFGKRQKFLKECRNDYKSLKNLLKNFFEISETRINDFPV